MSQTHEAPDCGSPPSTPGWVKVSTIIVIVLILLFGILMLTSIGGEHGPGRHILPNESSGYILPSEARGDTPPIEHGVQQL